jgi:hypothetical protein
MIKLITLLVNLFVFSANIIILVYLGRLKKCGCRLDNRHTFIKTVIIITFIIPIIVAILYTLFKKMISNNPKYLNYFSIILAVLYLVLYSAFVIYLYIYISDINKSECSCLTNDNLNGLHKFLMIYRYILIVIFAINFAVAFMNIYKRLN